MKPFRHIILSVIVLFTLSSFRAEGQANSFGIDEKVYSYYQKCVHSISDSVVLNMLDTLYKMAGDTDDKRMQIVSMSTRIDYYYYKGVQDSIITNVDRVKAVSKGGEFSRYYYFAWTRLISYYINVHYYNLALSEIEKMQIEAQEENNLTAVMQSQQMLGRLYLIWNNFEESYTCFTNAIKTILDNNLDKQYLFYLYNTCSLILSQSGKYEEAKAAIKESEKYPILPNQRYSYYLAFARIYVHSGDKERGKAYLDTLKSMSAPSPREYILYNELLIGYYKLLKQYNSALEVCDYLIQQSPSHNQQEYYFQKSDLLSILGKYDQSLIALKRYEVIKDSLDHDKFSKEMSEQTVILRLNEVQAEKQRVELELKNRWLIMTLIAILVLVIALVIFLFQFYNIRKLNKKLEKSEKIKTIFLQNLSHEVRTPINSILGFSEILSEGSISKKEVQSFSNIIYQNSKILLKLFDKALEASDVMVLKKRVMFDINDCCREVIDIVKREYGEDLSITFEECPQKCVKLIDKIGITKVLYNLLDNAIKYANVGEIVVRAEFISSSMFSISVTDQGPGIPLENQDKIFDAFYKDDIASSGFGLGLTLSKSIAETMNGTISFDNTISKGCRILLSFPV